MAFGARWAAKAHFWRNISIFLNMLKTKLVDALLVESYETNVETAKQLQTLVWFGVRLILASWVIPNVVGVESLKYHQNFYL